ncbi:MAG: amidase family protein [Planctomycetota bacterium]
MTQAATERLTELTANGLAVLISRGDVSSVEVVDAHIRRIEEVNPTLNAVTQPRFTEARREAVAADARRAAGQPLGPLHGVPVTVKDCFAVQGAAVTLGCERPLVELSAADSPLVARLRAAGAIVLGKTNVPQAMLLHECDNPRYGRTLHPEDPERSPGGSTGGEAAIVAAGGSPLGLASDLGGSIRQPAAACGLFGFKPTSGRLTLAGSRRAISPGMQAIAIQPGPICRSVADVDLAMRVLADHLLSPRQPDEGAAPWRDYRSVQLAGLRLTAWADDGVFRPAAGLARAIDEAAECLRRAGVTVVRVTPPSAETMMRVYLGLISADGMACVRRLLRGQRVDAQLARQTRLARLPRWLRASLGPPLKALGQGDLAQLLRWTGARSAGGYWRLVEQADAWRAAFWDDLSRRAGGPVDAMLSPAYGLPTLRHGTALHLVRAASHAFLANLLGAPAGVAPWGVVSAADEQAEAQGRTGVGLTEHFARQNAAGSSGLPLAVQVAAAPGDDHIALALMAALEAAAPPARASDAR